MHPKLLSPCAPWHEETENPVGSPRHPEKLTGKVFPGVAGILSISPALGLRVTHNSLLSGGVLEKACIQGLIGGGVVMATTGDQAREKQAPVVS